MPDGSPPRWSLWTGMGLFALIFALAHGLYWPSAEVPFLLDDLVSGVVFGPEEAGGGKLKEMLWPNDPSLDFNHHMRPLGWLSFALDVQLFGLDVRAIRAVAVSLLALFAGLAMRAAYLLGARSVLAICAGGLLIVAHGGVVEPVVWVCHRFTLLFAVFWMAGFVALIGYARHGGMARGTVFALALIGLLYSKDSGLALAPAFVPLAFILAEEDQRLRRAILVMGIVLLAIASNLILRYAATGHWMPKLEAGVEDAGGFAERVTLEAALWNGEALFSPVTVVEDSSPLRRAYAALLLVGLPLAALIAWMRGGRGASPAICGLLLAFGSALPQAVHASQSLAGSRSLLPVIGSLGLLFAGARGMIAPRVVLIAALLLLPSARIAQWPFAASGHVVAGLKEIVHNRAKGEARIVLSGLPSTIGTAPAFGMGTHVPLYFRPPFHPEMIPVRAGGAKARDEWLQSDARTPLYDLPLILDVQRLQWQKNKGLRFPRAEECRTEAVWQFVGLGGESPWPYPHPALQSRLRLAPVAFREPPQAFWLCLRADDKLLVSRILSPGMPGLAFDQQTGALQLDFGPNPLGFLPELQALLSREGSAVVSLQVIALPGADADAPLPCSPPLALRLRP